MRDQGEEVVNVHRDHLKKRYSSGRWFMVSRDLLAAFSIEETFVLSYLCNVGDQSGNPWFRLSREKVLHNLRISKRAHDRVMRSLESKKAIRTKRVGMPAKRYIFILYQNIERMVEDSLMAEAMAEPVEE